MASLKACCNLVPKRRRAPLLMAVWLAGALTVSSAGPDPLPRATPESVGLAAAPLSEATALLARFVAEHKIAGVVAAVARRGKLAYLEAAGFQNLEARTPMTERSLFRIYSMTKSVTAVAVMILLEEGRFALTDPVSRYLPEFAWVTVATDGATTRAPARPITIADLLLHTSGLNHRTSDQYRRARVRSRSIALPQFVENIVRVPLMEDPGTRYRYSESPTVLGRLVEIWSRQPFEVFLAERVFGPLGMSDTGFAARDGAAARLTTVYAPVAGGLQPVDLEEVPFTERPALIEGAVGLLSTVPDYLRFAQMLLNLGELGGVRILQKETVQSMVGNGLPDEVLRARGGVMGWGLANVNVVIDPAGLRYPANRGEYGWDGSAGTIFWIDPGKDLISILMTQSSPPNPDSLRQRFKTLVQSSLVD
jgi:CubicO group peptidase (beta-lactamase class C family)